MFNLHEVGLLLTVTGARWSRSAASNGYFGAQFDGFCTQRTSLRRDNQWANFYEAHTDHVLATETQGLNVPQISTNSSVNLACRGDGKCGRTEDDNINKGTPPRPGDLEYVRHAESRRWL